ncbi:MAG: MerR family transcriptional regulator [Brachymonas sp.]|nr:MerR family transcriptional regulator [Brachymonas sp.]
MPPLNPRTHHGYLIGQAAKMSGVSSANIRFYEAKGLISRQGMGAGSYRFYSDEDVHQLRFIRQLRSLDMTLDEVRTLLELDLRKKRDCATARATLDEHIGHVRERLKELRELEKNLVDLRSQCDGAGDRCHLIEALHAQADLPIAALGRQTLKRHAAL